MFEIKEISYEEARSEYLKEQMQRAQRSMKYWESRIDRSRPHNLMDVAHGKAADAGWEYSFYKDALEALENNKFQYETGFIKGFEAARPKWISVEDEQKPRHGKEYLCVCALPNDPKHEWDWIMVLRWYGQGSNGLVDRPHFTDEGVNGMYVTHWMPTPKLPKEE